jgi:hypothetical protein
MEKYRPALAAGIVICAGWFIWQIFVANRYQTLCQVHFWLATPAQIDSCKDMQQGLAGK